MEFRRGWTPMNADGAKRRPLRKLDYTRDGGQSRVPRAVLDWFGADYPFDSFWKSFRTAALFWTGLVGVFVVVQLLDPRRDRSAIAGDRSNAIFYVVCCAYPVLIVCSVVYALIGTKYSQRIANIVALGLAVASATLPLSYLWWKYR